MDPIYKRLDYYSQKKKKEEDRINKEKDTADKVEKNEIIQKLKNIETSEELIKSVGNPMTLHKKIYANIELIHEKWTEILKERPPKMKNIIGYFYSERPILLSKYNINSKADQTDIIRALYNYKEKNKNQSLNNVKEQPITVFNNTINNLLNEFNKKVNDKKNYINDEYKRIKDIPLPDPPNTNILDNALKFLNLNQEDNIQGKKSKIMNLLDNAMVVIENEKINNITPQPSEKDIIEKSTKLDLIVNNVEHKVKLFELEKENENNYQKLYGYIKEKEKHLNQLEQDLAGAKIEAIIISDNKQTTINEQNKIIEDYKNQLSDLKTSIAKEKKEKNDLIKQTETKIENLETAKELRDAELENLYVSINDKSHAIHSLDNINKQNENKINELKADLQKQSAERQQEIRKSDISDKKKDQQIKELKEQQKKNDIIFTNFQRQGDETRKILKQQLHQEKRKHKTDVEKLERKLGIQKEKAKKESSFGPLEVITNIFPVPFKNSLGFHIGNITTTHTGKKPYTSTDTVDHYLYNLYNQIQDERSTQKAINDDKTHFKNHKRIMVHYPVRFKTDDQGNRIQPNNQPVKLNIHNQGNRIQSNDDDDDDTPLERGGGKNNTRRTRKRVVKIKHKRNTRRPIKKINNKTRKENK